MKFGENKRLTSYWSYGDNIGMEKAFSYIDVEKALNQFHKLYWEYSHTGDKFKKYITCDDLDYLMAKVFGDIVKIETLQDLREFGDFNKQE